MDSILDQYNYLFNIIIIGDSSVGKTCFLSQFTEKRFNENFDPTIGVEFGAGIVKINDKIAKLKIWDTAGQECFRSITRSYYRGAICAILMYDVTNKESFQNILKWIEEVKSNGNDKIVCMIVGNKTDLSHKRQVSYDEGEEFAKLHYMEFMESSARTGQNIEMIFRKLSEIVIEKIQNKLINPLDEIYGIKIGTKESPAKVNFNVASSASSYTQIGESKKSFPCCNS